MKFSRFKNYYHMKQVGYIVGQDPKYQLTTNLIREIASFLAKSKKRPAAFVWDDVFFTTDKFNKPNLAQLYWPKLDYLSYSQPDHTNRCAIRTDVMEGFHFSKLIRNMGDTSGALREILKKSDEYEVVYLDEVFRFVGDEKSSVYEIQAKQPKPSQTANTISCIINYKNAAKLTIDLLDSLKKQKMSASKVELVLINNQSDSSENKKIISFANQHLSNRFKIIPIDYDQEFNHSAQCNLGVSQSSGEVIVFLNNDARLIDTNTLQTLANWSLEPNVATAGPRFVGDQNKLVSSGVSIFPRIKPNEPTWYAIKEDNIEPLSKIIRLSAGNTFACAALSRKSFEQIGPLNDQEFKSQFNDAEYFMRALDKGYRHLYIGTKTVFHQPGGSEIKSKETIRSLRKKVCAMYPNMPNYSNLNPRIQRDFNAGRLFFGRVNRTYLTSVRMVRKASGVSPWACKQIIRQMIHSKNWASQKLPQVFARNTLVHDLKGTGFKR